MTQHLQSLEQFVQSVASNPFVTNLLLFKKQLEVLLLTQIGICGIRVAVAKTGTRNDEGVIEITEVVNVFIMMANNPKKRNHLLLT